MKKVLIIGAGPAGLAAAYEFLKLKKLDRFQIEIYEAEDQVGGLSKTLNYKGFRFDLGGHRFYTKFSEIESFYKNFLRKDMLKRSRLSRIYYRKKFYNYPLSASNALRNLGFTQSTKIVYSWLSRQLNRHKSERTFDEWVSNRFGDELFKIFFKSYTEKVWGIDTSQLSADWAAQRIQNFTLGKAIINALFKINPGSKTIINSFYYPKYGPGMLYKKIVTLLIKNGVKIFLNHNVSGLSSQNKSIETLHIQNMNTGKKMRVKADYVISTMPFDKLILSLSPQEDVREKTRGLRFRNFITVNLIIASNPFPDQWIYVHDSHVKVGRIQNFRNWSPFMVKLGSKNTPVGMEYFTSENDPLWNLQDKELFLLARDEIVKIGLISPKAVLDGFVYRVKNAYPIYNFNYQKPLALGKKFVSNFSNLYPCGRGGLFRYNNQDHSILAGFYTARNIIAGRNIHDVWSINDEREYLEENAKN